MITLQTIDEIDKQSVYTGIKSTGPSGIGYNSHLYLRKSDENEWKYTEFLTIDTKGQFHSDIINMFLAGIVARGMKEFYNSIREDGHEDDNASIDSQFTDNQSNLDQSS